MPEPKLNLVCLMAGSGLPDYYVDRLYRMLDREAGRSFQLFCLTDRPRPLPSEVQAIDISAWPKVRPDMRITQLKLRLFEPGALPVQEFFYMDVTLVIKSAMEPIWRFAESRQEPLVILQDWHMKTVNSCFMRIKPTESLRVIYDAYREGVKYPVKLLGDQDYLDAVIKDKGLENQVAHFPQELIASYKQLRRLNRRDNVAAKQLLDGACIVKFHGTPRPHDLFTFRYRLKEALRSPGHAIGDWGYLSKQIKSWWMGEH